MRTSYQFLSISTIKGCKIIFFFLIPFLSCPCLISHSSSPSLSQLSPSSPPSNLPHLTSFLPPLTFLLPDYLLGNATMKTWRYFADNGWRTRLIPPWSPLHNGETQALCLMTGGWRWRKEEEWRIVGRRIQQYSQVHVAQFLTINSTYR